MLQLGVAIGVLTLFWLPVDKRSWVATGWITVYHVFDAYGYRISLKGQSLKGEPIHAKSYNADKREAPILQIFLRGREDTNQIAWDLFLAPVKA